MIPFNPAQSVKPPKELPDRVRYLRPTELRALLEACTVWLQPIVTLAVTMGMRRGEILGLRRIDIDLPKSTLWLPQTKNGDGRMFPLNSLAKAALDSIALQGGSSEAGRLFPTYITADSVSVAFHRACRKAGIEDFRFYDLRHTAASWLRMSGAHTHTVALVLGHKSLRMASARRF